MKYLLAALALIAMPAVAAPMVEATGDMVWTLFNPSPVVEELTLDSYSVVVMEQGFTITDVPLGGVVAVNGSAFFTPTLTTAIDYTVYVDSNYPGLLFDYDGGQVASCTNCVLSEVPIPASVWLFGSALVGLGVIRRRG